MFKLLIVGNWKMQGTVESAVALASQLGEQWNSNKSVEMIIFPPFIHISAVAATIAETAISLGGQNVSEYPSGAYTGEISAEMLVDKAVSMPWWGTLSDEHSLMKVVRRSRKSLRQHRVQV